MVHTLFKDKKSIWQKLGHYGHYRHDPKTSLTSPIHLHCVSVGELNACKPLIAKLLEHHHVIITSTTKTGYMTAKSFCQGRDNIEHYYFPFDTLLAPKRFLSRFNPKMSVMFETEIWANFSKACHTRSLPLALINARMSQRSCHKYAKFSALTMRVLGYFSLIATQNEESTKRFQELGYMHPITLPSIKFDTDTSLDTTKLAEVSALIGGRRAIVCASTHNDEEEQIITAYKEAASQELLVIIPRHPQRFGEVEQLLITHQCNYTKQSDHQNGSTNPKATIILADSMGYVKEYYKHSSVAFIGGSLAPGIGGHNMLEAMAFDTLVMSGKHTFNFELVSHLIQEKALLEIDNAQELFAISERYATHPLEYTHHINNAQKILQANTGATTSLAKLLDKMLD